MKPTLRSFAAALALLLVCAGTLRAQVNATWTGATDGNWNAFTNWNSIAPNSSTDTATFSTSGNTNISFSANTTVGLVTFQSGADAYNFNITSGRFLALFNGVVNNSTNVQTFTVGGGGLMFVQTSGSMADSIIDNSGTIGLTDSISLGSATLTTHSGGSITFNATVSGGAARLITEAGGTVDFGSLNTSTSVGSIEGDGTYHLSSKTVTVGTNNLSTVVSGAIDGTGGSLIKTGTGTLTLSGTNTYTGSTTINGGTLQLAGSNTLSGNGAVIVNSGGTLMGNDFIFNSITVNSGGHLAADRDNDLQFAGGGLTLHGGAQLDFSIGENPNTFFSVIGGDFTTDGTVTINITEAGGFGSDSTYTLLDFSGADNVFLSGGSFVLGSAVSGYDLAVNGNMLQLTASAIPEPSTYAMFAGLGALGLVIVRRRKLAA